MTPHEQLLDAIGAALGQGGAYLEMLGERDEVIHLGSGTSPPITSSREVLGGAIGPNGCVGWIEQRSEPPQGQHVPVEIDVRVVVDGQLHVSVLETYNPYFGCRVHFAAWVAEGFVFVYTEKHRTILARFAAPYLEQKLVTLHDALLIVDERILDLDEYEGLLHVRRLSDLEPGIAVLTQLAYDDDEVPCSQELRLDDAGAVTLAILPADEAVPGIAELGYREAYEARRRLATCHSIPLPPDRQIPSLEQLRARWIALLGGGSQAAERVDSLAAAWLAPQPTTSTYPYRSRHREMLGAGWPEPLRATLPKAPPIHGWPSEGSFDERLDRMFLALVGRIAG
jgi:hypothetical protein